MRGGGVASRAREPFDFEGWRWKEAAAAGREPDGGQDLDSRRVGFLSLVVDFVSSIIRLSCRRDCLLPACGRRSRSRRRRRPYCSPPGATGGRNLSTDPRASLFALLAAGVSNTPTTASSGSRRIRHCCLLQESMAWGGLFLSFGRPTKEQQKSCLATAGGFNYDPALHGATHPKSASTLTSEAAAAETSDKDLIQRGFFVNRSRVLIGSGADTFLHAKSTLLSWRQLALGWANVEPDTPVKVGTRFCICYKELIPWVMLPLQIAYVIEGDGKSSESKKGSSMFAFGSGTLQGHLLAGEERFSVQVDEEDRVWYEVVSFSKPAHVLATLCYPYVQLRQKHFAHQSGQALLRHVATASAANQ